MRGWYGGRLSEWRPAQLESLLQRCSHPGRGSLSGRHENSGKTVRTLEGSVPLYTLFINSHQRSQQHWPPQWQRWHKQRKWGVPWRAEGVADEANTDHTSHQCQTPGKLSAMTASSPIRWNGLVMRRNSERQVSRPWITAAPECA